MSYTASFGKLGEQYVARWLMSHKFTILEYNFKTKLAEIDLIAQQKNMLVFVEVKTRKRAYFHSSHVVTKFKQRKIIKAAKYYIALHTITDMVCRFDVALIIGPSDAYKLHYIPNAFAIE